MILLAGLALSLGEASGVSPWLRVIVGLLVFILPGCFIFLLFPTRESWDIIDIAVYGFTYSLALITILGLITRAFSLSIDTIEMVWFILTAVGFAAALKRWRNLPNGSVQIRAPLLAVLAIVLCQVGLYIHASIIATPSSKDQHRHHAVINGFLRDDPLGWKEPYYETSNAVADREYLTYWVLAQALVVDISHVPILHARFLISPFVVVMSVAAMYIAARNLGHSRRSSLIYVSLSLLALSLIAELEPQAGTRFFVRPQLDKVVSAFAIAPVAISTAYLCSVSGQRRAYFGYAVALLVTCSVHAIVGGFTVAIIGIWCLVCVVAKAGGRRHAIYIGLLALVVFAPTIMLRLATAETTIYNFDYVDDSVPQKMVVYDSPNPLNNGERYYAISPLAAGDLTYILLPLVILCVIARRLDDRSRLMLAYTIAISIGMFPYTAWIYGRLVSFNHVMRILWLMPFGYMIGFVIETVGKLLGRLIPPTKLYYVTLFGAWLRAAFVLSVLSATAYFLHFEGRADFSRDITTAVNGSNDLLEIAGYIDSRHDNRVWIAATDKFREQILAMHWKVISLSRFSPERMSYYSTLPIDYMRTQTADNSRLYEAHVPVEEKLAIVDRYGIDYLLFPKEYAWMVDALYQRDKQRFELVYSGETLRLVRIHG
ncbi:MAG: hypothetical protein OXG78_05570 [Chloroflexi bacterium]|nr:hypothetical protein [Chloroflexota bacterium]